MSRGRYRYLICIPDGAADERYQQLGGQTPLDAARMPILSRLRAQGRQGFAQTIPAGMPAASDVGLMSILGYDPRVFHTGRAPLEAAALGVPFDRERVVFRANLVTVAEHGAILDFTGGHPNQAQAGAAMNIRQERLGGEVGFHAGLGYRNLMTAPADWASAVCVPPHEIQDQPPVLPEGQGADELRRIMETSRDILSTLSMRANQIWLWGQGRTTVLPALAEALRVRGALIAAVAVARGLGMLSGMSVPDVPGATGWYDTDYTAKRDAAIQAFEEGHDLVIIHVAATDEAAHAGDLTAKVAALENWDHRILAGLSSYLDASGPWRLLWIPDHATSTARKMHTAEPVPFVLYDSAGPAGGDLPSTAMHLAHLLVAARTPLS
jgi:2,3-bisphosphoglycerate-independent phosphoglycerate mutase